MESKHTSPVGIIVIDDKTSHSLFFRDLNRFLSSLRNVNRISFDEVSTVLGQTVDFLFVDLRTDFIPNKINVLLETVRGGGVIFILGCPYSEWVYSVNKKRAFLEKGPPAKIKRMKSIFLGWFLENIKFNSQCKTSVSSSSEVVARFNPMPYSINLTTQIKDIPVTSEQKKVV